MQYKINLRTTLLTLALVATAGIPITAWALGLGQLKSDTRIGQPFSARIPITGASAGVLQGLRVELASPEAYKSANLSVPDYLYSLKFSVEQGANGAYIKVSSDKPVKLPFLNLLINARWNSGQVTRQYTVLLNPPVFVSGNQSQQPVSAPSSPAQAQQSTASQQQAPAPQPAPQQQKPAESQQTTSVEQPTQSTQSTQSTQTSPASSPSTPAYPKQEETPSGTPSTYTVQHGDTLWGLSRHMRPSSGVSVNRMMIAVYRANPHAFRGNINRLKSGAVLQMPSQSQIAQITAEEATRIVARQNNEWQGGQVAANGNAPAKAATGSATGQSTESQSAGGQTASESQSGVSEQALPAATAGRVVLTTPEVTASNTVAAAPGSAVSGTSSSAAMAGAVSGTSAVAAGAGVASAEASSQTPAKSAEQAGTGASAGGPLKVQSNAMAGLAGAGSKAGNTAGTSAGAETATSATAKNSQPAGQQAKNVANNVSSVNSVGTTSSEETEGGSGLMYWVEQPSGWIVIGAVVLLLGALLLFIVKRRKSNSGTGPQAAVAGKGLSDRDDDGSHDAGPEASGNIKAGIPHETENRFANVAAEAESNGHEDDDELGIATYIGGPSLDVNKVDAIDEADLHVGFGDYNKAAEVLRAAIDRDPSRAELRRKLLDVLFAAGDAAGFANEAAVYRDQVDAAAWEEAAVMGRQLLPQEPLFASGRGPAETAVAEENQGEGDAGDFLDLDLDRLSSDTESQSDQSEFERTMDELSTFIETYVPASAETPVSLQLPPEEEEAAEKPRTDSQADVPDDEPLEFTLDEGDLPAPSDNDLDLAFGEGDESGDENLVDTKLDLARAYIDMGDGDSARSVLEEVIDEGDETQSGEAKRLLETLG